MNKAANLIAYTSDSGLVSSSTSHLHGSTSSFNQSTRTLPTAGRNAGGGHHQNPPPLSLGLGGFLVQNPPPLYPDSDTAGGGGGGGGNLGRALRVMLTTPPTNTTTMTSAYLDLGHVSAGGGGQTEAGNYTSEDLWHENEAYARVLIPSMVYVAVLMLIGVPGNSLVVYVYGFQFRAATQHFLIVCLAVCDLVVGVIAMPTEIADLRFPFTFSSDFACRLLRFVNLFCSLTSNCLLVVIAVDRYRRVCLPLNHQMRMREARVGAALSVAVSLLISWPALVVMGLRTLKTSQDGLLGKGCSFSDEYYGTAYPMLLVGTLGAGFVVMTVVLAVLYFKIWRQTRAHSSRYSHHASRSFHHHHHHRRKGRSGITTSQTSPACSPPATPDLAAAGGPRFVSLAAARLGSVSPLAADDDDADVDGVVASRESRASQQSDPQAPSSSLSSSSSTSTSLCCCGSPARLGFSPDSPVNNGGVGREFHQTRGRRDGTLCQDSSATRVTPREAGSTTSSRSTPELLFPAVASAGFTSPEEVRDDDDSDTRRTVYATGVTLPCCGCRQQTSPRVTDGSDAASTPATLRSSGAREGRGDKHGQRDSFTGCGLLQRSGLLRRPTARSASVSRDACVTGAGGDGDGGVPLSRCNGVEMSTSRCNSVEMFPSRRYSVETSPSGSNSVNVFSPLRKNVDMSPSRSNSADGFPSRSYSVDMFPGRSNSADLFPSRRYNVDMFPERSNSADGFSSRRYSVDMFPERSNSADGFPSRRYSVDMFPERSNSADGFSSRRYSVDMFPERSNSADEFPSRRYSVDMFPERSNSADVFPSRSYSVDMSPSSSDNVNMVSSRRRNVHVSPSRSNSADVFSSHRHTVTESLLRSSNEDPPLSPCHSLEPPFSRSKSVDMSPSLNSRRETPSSRSRTSPDVTMPRCTGAHASRERCQCSGTSQSRVSHRGNTSPPLPSYADVCPSHNDDSDTCPRLRDELGKSPAVCDSVGGYSSLTCRTDPRPHSRLDVFPEPQQSVREPPSCNGDVDASLSLANNTDSPRSNTGVPKSRSRNTDASPSSRNNGDGSASRSRSVVKSSSTLASKTAFRVPSRSSSVDRFPLPRVNNGVPPARGPSVDMRPSRGLSRSEEISLSSKWRKCDIYRRFRSTSSTELDSISVITVTTAPSSYYDDTSLAGTESRNEQSAACLRCFKGGCNMDKITLVAFAVTLVFVVSFLPYLTLNVVRGFFGGLDQSLSGSGEVNAYNIFVRSYFLNYAANPVIYGVFNARFRRECVTLFKKLTSCCALLRRRHSLRKS